MISTRDIRITLKHIAEDVLGAGDNLVDDQPLAIDHIISALNNVHTALTEIADQIDAIENECASKEALDNLSNRVDGIE